MGPMELGQEAKVHAGSSLKSRQANSIAVCPSVKSGPRAKRFSCFAFKAETKTVIILFLKVFSTTSDSFVCVCVFPNNSVTNLGLH